MVGMRGSSQPDTRPSWTRRRRFLFERMVWVILSREKLDLTRGEDLGLANEPIVEGAMYLVAQVAQRVSDALNRVGHRLLEVVHRIDAPGVSGAVVRLALDPVHWEDRA